MTDNEIIKAFHSLYIKLLDVKYELKITQKEFLALNEVHNLITRQQAEIKTLTNNLEAMAVTMRNSAKATRQEAVKAFAERLKEKKRKLDRFILYDEDIDNLVKEMAGEGNDKLR